MAQLGSFRYNFAQKSKQKLLSNLDDDHDDEGEDKGGFCSCGWFGKVRDWIRLGIWWSWLRGTATNVWDFGRSDPRKVVFAAKMGLALTLLSFLIFLKEPFESLSRYSVWAILTVVVVFEFSIGATLSKGFNRGLGTLFAGGLALAVAELSVLTGDWEEFVIIIGIYIAGFVTNFLKLYPTMKPYEYGFRVFLITFCFIVVSGYRTGTFVETAVNRFLLICLGASVALAVNIFIYPIWAGEDLHKLVAKNFDNVAKSLEGCVNGYLQCVEYKRIPSKILRYEVSDDLLYSGYRSAVESKSQEDALLGFAIWEPPHGPYNMFNYPWKSYVKVSGALRHCAFAVMALHGCILSEIQAPPQRRQVFSNELQKVGIEGAKVLRELGSKLSAMTRLSSIDILSEVHDAVEELQNKIDRRSYLLVNSESWEIGNRTGHTGNEQGHTVVPERDAHHLVGKSQSEALLDLSYIQIPKSWDFDASGNSTPSILEHQESTLTTYPQEAKFQKQTSFLSRQSFHQDASVINVGESKTYESASALSLATFSSLLIEFVARLSFLVDSFEELSNKAKFKEPVEGQPQGSRGFWARLCRCFL